MLEYIRQNIIKLIPRVISALKKRDVLALKDLSNRTIHSASVYQDQSSLTFALTVYSLSKIVERGKDSKAFANFLNKVVEGLEHSRDLLLVNNIDGYKKNRNSLLESIGKMDNKLKFYIEEVIDKAKIKKGSKLHEHGLSIRKVSDLLGISQWELMNYIGKVKLEYTKPAVGIMERLKFARKLFEI